MRVFYAWILAVLAAAIPSFGGDKISPDRVREIAGWLPERPAGFGWPITNRAAWTRLAGLPAFARVVANADPLLLKPLPELPDELFLDYSRTGNRDRWQHVAFERRGRIAKLTLAEALENKGRFLPPLEEVIAALCAERTWVYPAHDAALDNFYGRQSVPDLGAVFMAMELAEADYILGDRLRPETRRLLRENIDRRVLEPFKAMVEGRQKEAFWMRIKNNWNAVCLGSITTAALAVKEKPEDRAFFIAASERYIRHYLEGFTSDGYCGEGVGYWNYGFGHFILLSEAVRQATGARLDLMSDPAAAQPAFFCVRSEIINGVYPTISDVHPGTKPDRQLADYVRERFGLNTPPAGKGLPLAGMSQGLAMTLMFSSLEAPLPVARAMGIGPESPLRSWFKDGGVLLCRTGAGNQPAFGVAIKGGHNAENHNHNDVGSFSVVVGHTMLICDPGAEVYTARTFGPHRYDSKVLNSYGHAVPVVGQQLQRPGAEARAVVLQQEFSEAMDTLKLDIQSAYQAKDLKRLERTFVFRRGSAPALEVCDEAGFGTPQSFESALITWGEWRQASTNTLEIRDGSEAVSVNIDTHGQAFQVRGETIDENVPTSRKPVRIGIALQAPATNVFVRLRIEPLGAEPGPARSNP
jgi:hypothetical protein